MGGGPARQQLRARCRRPPLGSAGYAVPGLSPLPPAVPALQAVGWAARQAGRCSFFLAFSSTTSPGTSSRTASSTHAPSRRHTAVGADSSCSSLMALPVQAGRARGGVAAVLEREGDLSGPRFQMPTKALLSPKKKPIKTDLCTCFYELPTCVALGPPAHPHNDLQLDHQQHEARVAARPIVLESHADDGGCDDDEADPVCGGWGRGRKGLGERGGVPAGRGARPRGLLGGGRQVVARTGVAVQDVPPPGLQGGRPALRSAQMGCGGAQHAGRPRRTAGAWLPCTHACMGAR